MLKISNNFKTFISGGLLALITSCATMKTGNSNNLIVAREQAQVDSLYYRTLFNQTQLANNSEAVAEFNKISAQMNSLKSVRRRDLSREILNNAQQIGITKEQKNIIRGVQYISNKAAIESKQQYADRFVFEQFFKKYGIQNKLK